MARKKKKFSGMYWPAREKVEFDAGPIVERCLEEFSDSLYVSASLDLRTGYLKGHAPKWAEGKIGFFIHSLHPDLGFCGWLGKRPVTLESLMIGLAEDKVGGDCTRRQALNIVADALVQCADRIRKAR